jgi:RsiW-degrading membrane proteinase PrsW (M82 family)
LGSALACGALAMCTMWVGNCFKKCAVEKNKKHWVGLSACLFGRQVGFLVLLIFHFSVLFQWFTFNVSMSLSLFFYTLGGNLIIINQYFSNDSTVISFF